MYGFIYVTINRINGRKYIGMCSFEKDTSQNYTYLGSGTLLKRAIRKNGRENFTRVILEQCETFEDLSTAEQKWITMLNAVDSDEFYNLSFGGYGGNTETLKEFWSRFTPQERKQLRRWRRPDHSGCKNPHWGKHHSEETKRKIGAKSTNRNWNHPDHKGSKNPRAQKCRISYNGKTETFDCLKDFADKYQLHYGMVKTISRSGPTTRGKYVGIHIEKI